ncbi:hypothetical protein AGR2A_pb10004 [Agrobacterium genomosp. 2 str. CFBP 5494]|uniref:Uncharacterized protein n=1 Tax=Agrobacterium genomosp. 2 str. CFBP 5494 TaxID=1183436 RepID=A0A9W5B7B6_9HYPH|nr:hypothetical protein AGR2A_pb10004 [Agrobacterium genomosp. 2 str. CFBP 5494]
MTPVVLDRSPMVSMLPPSPNAAGAGRDKLAHHANLNPRTTERYVSNGSEHVRIYKWQIKQNVGVWQPLHFFSPVRAAPGLT